MEMEAEVEAINNQLEPITYNVSEAEISSLKAKYRDIQIKDNGGYKLAVAGISEARALRVSIEKRRKQLKAGALEFGRKVDSIAAALTQKILKIECPLRDAKSEIDAEKARIKAEKERLEKERVEGIKQKIEKIMDLTNRAVVRTATELKKDILSLEAMKIEEETYQEFTTQARACKTTMLVWLRGTHDNKAKLEKEEERLQEERKQQEIERQKISEEKRQISEKQRKVDEESRRVKKRKREQEEQEEAEKRRRSAAEQEANLAAKNKQHRETICSEVVDSLATYGIQQQTGRELVKRISEQSLDHLAIIY